MIKINQIKIITSRGANPETKLEEQINNFGKQNKILSVSITSIKYADYIKYTAAVLYKSR